MEIGGQRTRDTWQRARRDAWRLTCLSLIAAATLAQPATAQTSVPVLPPAGNAGDGASVSTAESPVLWDRSQWRVGPFVGRARQSPVRESLGITPGRDHVFVGVQALTSILRVRGVELSYAAQLLPIVRLQGRAAPVGYTGLASDVPLLRSPAVAYAIGLSPFGLELTSPRSARLSVFGATAAGGLLFSRPYPVPEAARLNFTLEYGGGVLVRAGDSRWLRVGYKYHHLSNAYTADENPGVDGNVWYAGLEWGLSLPR